MYGISVTLPLRWYSLALITPFWTSHQIPNSAGHQLSSPVGSDTFHTLKPEQVFWEAEDFFIVLSVSGCWESDRSDFYPPPFLSYLNVFSQSLLKHSWLIRL